MNNTEKFMLNYLLLFISSLFFVNAIETNIKLKLCMPMKWGKDIYGYHYSLNINSKDYNYTNNDIYYKINICENSLSCCTPGDMFCWQIKFDEKLEECFLNFANNQINCYDDVINDSSSGICYRLNKTYNF